MKTYSIAAILLLTTVCAQSQGIINVDLFDTQDNIAPLPYGPGAAAIGSSGDYWNGLNSNTQIGSLALKYNDGTASPIGFNLGLIDGLNGGTTGGTYGLLFDDNEEEATGHAAQITGLSPNGQYNLYLYSGNNSGGINVNGTVFSSAKTYFSAYNSLVLGTEYDEHTVTADGSGDLNLTAITHTGNSEFSAFQLEAIPEPSTFALVALGASLLVAARPKKPLL